MDVNRVAGGGDLEGGSLDESGIAPDLDAAVAGLRDGCSVKIERAVLGIDSDAPVFGLDGASNGAVAEGTVGL